MSIDRFFFPHDVLSFHTLMLVVDRADGWRIVFIFMFFSYLDRGVLDIRLDTHMGGDSFISF
jgi:hypothetical protein